MSRIVEVVLGPTTYRVPRLNLDEIEQLIDIWSEATPEGDTWKFFFRRGRRIAEILFCRADPPVEDFGKIECSAQELQDASNAILAFSGMRKADDTGEAEPKAV